MYINNEEKGVRFQSTATGWFAYSK